jgi:adenine phosphoribosyltransferase
MYRATIGSQVVDLPIVPLDADVAIALLITVDLGISFCEHAGRELAAILKDRDVDVVASVATMGIPFAIEVSRALGLDEYVIFHKTPKIHLRDAVAEPVRSITTELPQRLLLDRARIHAVEHRRVALIDDVISTGSSAAAAMRLLRTVGATPVALGAIVTEGDAWRATLGDDAELVQSLGVLPLFSHRADGGYEERTTG